MISNTINKCTATVTVEVEQDIAEPLAVAGDSVALTCALPNAQLNGAGSSTGSQFVYNWSTLDGQILSGETTLQPEISAPGIYTIQVTDLSNGCTSEASVLVSQDITPPLAAAVAPEIMTCSTQMVTLNGNGSSTGSMFNYQWTTANGQIIGGGNSLSPTVGAAGDYTLLVTNSVNGCSQSAVVTVHESVDPPSVSPDNSGTITCMISHLTLNGNGVSGSGAGLSYSWTTTDGSIVSGSDSPTPVVNAGGLYTLLVTDLYNGCTATAEVLVPTDLGTPFVSVVQPDILTCNILSVTIDASVSAQGNEYSYVWNGPGIMSGNNTLSPTVNQAGNYQLQIFNNDNGCSSSSEVIVPQDIEAPVADAGEGFSLACSVTEGHLDASGSSAGPGFSYFWTTPDGNIITDPTSADPLVNAIGNYFLLVTNTANGCTATDYVQVIENTNYPNSLELYVEPPGCKSKPGLVKIVEVHGGFGPYLYSIDGGNTFGTANQFEDIDPGQYQLVIQDAFGCEYEQTLTFTEPVQPVVTTAPEISLAFGDSTTLKVSFNLPLNQIDTIIWTPYETLTPTDWPYEMTAKPFSSILYTVEVISIDGCSDLASIRVKVDNPHIWAPNAFSPHREDGWNDKFLIFASPNTVKNIKTLQIFDRWGDMVFRNDNIQPNDENLGWNGFFREQPMNPAVFVWWAEIELFSGQQIIMYGDVTIVD
ncbi:MAG: hypothetical protein EPGJADBJ_04858 [Saprospiraceae bacterium]|nr:hypothetical protein [Saprospiraceae bacterium]